MGRPLLGLLLALLAGCRSGFDRDDARGMLRAVEDVVGRASTSNATAIRGTPISATAPTNGQALTYNGTMWAPATPAGVGSAGSVSLVSAQVNSVDAATPAFGNLHSYSVPAQAVDGAAIELEAIALCLTPNDDADWRVTLGGVQVATSSPFTITSNFTYERYLVRIVRTGATTGRYSFRRRSAAGAITEVVNNVAGLDWSVAQTLQSQGLHASDGTRFAEVQFSVKLETPP